MTDLEMTKLCGDAMGYQSSLPASGVYLHWDPLTNDAQAMALVKRLNISIIRTYPGDVGWTAQTSYSHGPHGAAFSPDLNRAIVECVAQMQQSKATVPA